MHENGALGRSKNYIRIPLYLSVIWLALIVALARLVGARAAIITTITFLVYIGLSVLLYVINKKRLEKDFISFAAQYGQVQNRLLREFSLPYAMLDTKGTILWMNEEFSTLVGRNEDYRKNISTVLPQITSADLPTKSRNHELIIRQDERIYRAQMHRILMQEMLDFEEAEADLSKNTIITLCLFDETETTLMEEDLENNRMVFGVLSLDNYDEALESVDELKRSLLLALIERKINIYFTNVDGIVRKTDNDRYYFIIRRKALTELETGRFAILSDVKTVNVGNEVPMSISIGVGYGGKTFLENAETAQSAFELALGRGGDQAVVREGYTTRYYGGMSESPEGYTRVKARVKAQALKEILADKEEIFIMGHKIADVDALGAAIGFVRCALTIEKPVHIVFDELPETLSVFYEAFKERGYPRDLFIDCAQALEKANASSVVIVVDTNNPEYTECPELLEKTETVIVLDHHRQGTQVIQNAALSYVEPYASSACEMVTEILQYFDEKLRLHSIEADCLYAGIMLDTSNFLTRTGVRTFEAAAFLRRNGADVTRIRKLFRDNLEDVRAKSATIANAEIFDENFAIAVCPAEGLKSPTVITAQTANELLTVVGVQASFVLTSYNGMVYISARAIDEVNVQLIMERLGGGGHLNIAGAQLSDMSIDEAIRLLKNTIRQMKEEGDI